VLLVNPPLDNLISANVPSFVEEERGKYPPLGLLYIASYLREYGPKEAEVLVLDTVLEDMSHEDIEYYILKIRPDVVAIQTLTFTLIDSLHVARMTKKINPHIVTVLGGRQCDIFPEEVIRFDFVDYVIQGEGEVAFTEFIKNLHDKSNLRKISGLVFKNNQRAIINRPKVIKNLNQLPFPARELTDYRKYRFLLAKNSLFTTLMTSRGCPYACSFCDEGRRQFRTVSVSRVVDEIVTCKKKFGINAFFIFDSTFTISRQRVLDFCDDLIERKLDVIFDIRSRTDLVDDEILNKLRRAGCIRIQYGVESGNNAILKKIKKNITVDQIKSVMDKTRKYGFEILCDFMIGLPGEREKEIMDTINLSLNLPIDYAHFGIMIPYPNTEIYFDGIKRKLFGDYWREFSLHPTTNFEPKVWEEYFNKEQLIQFLSLAYSKFYKRPQYLFQQLFKVRSFGELSRKIKGGVKVFTHT
ncbi:MAG: B12-binding domain-containing radical SAM protein, partial [Candidatus Zixiibacteriota bacterium]